jgi:hypothetical protein
MCLLKWVIGNVCFEDVIEYYRERIWYFTLIYNTNEWKQKKTCRKGGNESKTGKKTLGNVSKQVKKSR